MIEMKKTILVLFGGHSSEHEVSCKSAVNVIRNIDPQRYDTVLVGITREGRWVLADGTPSIEDGSWVKGKRSAWLLPDASRQAVAVMDEDGHTELIHVDAAFPVLHGLWGEDGTVQGLFELAGIPYVGCGVLASAVSMDKLYTKIVVNAIGGIRQADYVPVFSDELKDMAAVISRIENKFSYPVFIKPANEGSSCGITRAENREMLTAGLKLAAGHDRKILVEENIKGREIECAVFGGGAQPVRAFGVGEVQAAGVYYDYDAKYNNPESRTVVEPELPAGAREQIMSGAEAIFRAVDGYGLARVDFFVTESGEVIFNELNTLPGFTAISMYPMIMEASGVDKKQLMTNLIENGMGRTR